MGDHSQDVTTTSRRSRRTVFKGPIRGFIHHARGRGEVVAYSEYNDARSTSPARFVGNESETPLHDVERFSGGELQPRGNTNENRANSGDNLDISLREDRKIQHPHRPSSQDSHDLAESRAIVEDLLRRAVVAGQAHSANQVETSSAIKTENQEIRGSDERISDSENGRVLSTSQLEQEFRAVSPDMQRYLIWLQRATGSEYVFARHDQTVRAPPSVREDVSQR